MQNLSQLARVCLTYSGTFIERNQWHLQEKLQTLCPTKTLGQYNSILVSPNPARPFTKKYSTQTGLCVCENMLPS